MPIVGDVEAVMKRAAPLADALNSAISRALDRASMDGTVILVALRMLRNAQAKQQSPQVIAQIDALEDAVDREMFGGKNFLVRM